MHPTQFRVLSSEDRAFQLVEPTVANKQAADRVMARARFIRPEKSAELRSIHGWGFPKMEGSEVNDPLGPSLSVEDANAELVAVLFEDAPGDFDAGDVNGHEVSRAYEALTSAFFGTPPKAGHSSPPPSEAPNAALAKALRAAAEVLDPPKKPPQAA